jgi:phosphoglycolate phosphatase
MNYNWVFFDFDGTIADSSSGIIQCIQNASVCAGIGPIEEERVRCVIGPTLPTMIKKIFPDIDDERAQIMFREYRKDYATLGVAGVEVYQGIPELLAQLKNSGKKMCIVSSKPEKYLVEICRNLGISGLFEDIRGVDLSQNPLNKTELLRGLLDKFHVERETAVMVGDTASDVKAAKENGISSVGVEFGFGSFKGQDMQPDHLCNTVQDLIDFFERM